MTWPEPPRTPVRRLLLAIGGHLGDAVVLTAALRWMAREHPEVDVGVVLPTWSRIVLAQHSGIKWMHSIDHWKNIRGPVSRWGKWRRYQATVDLARAEIRAVHYDAVVDLHTHYPNMAVPLSMTGIPVRMGYESGGFGALYTECVPLDDVSGHMAERHVAMLRRLFASDDRRADCRYALPASSAHTIRSTHRLLVDRIPDMDNYFVVHMRAGASGRDWPVSAWRELVHQLQSDEVTVVFTGAGAAERDAIATVIDGCPHCVDLCDELAWPQLVHLIRRARLVVTVDTVAAHIAAATGTPSVVIWPSMTDESLWRPLAENAHLVPRKARPLEVAQMIKDVLDDRPSSHAASPLFATVNTT